MTSRTAYTMSKPMTPTLFSGHYLRNRSTLDIGVLGYIGIVQHKEHSPEVLHIPPGTPRILQWCNLHYSVPITQQEITVHPDHGGSKFSDISLFF